MYYVLPTTNWKVLYSSKCHGFVLCGVVLCGVMWCGVVWCGVVLCGVVWCGVVWCGVVWCGVVWRSVVQYLLIGLKVNKFIYLATLTPTGGPRIVARCLPCGAY